MANILPDLIRKLVPYLFVLLCISTYAQDGPEISQLKELETEFPADSIVLDDEPALIQDSVAVADSSRSTVLDAKIAYNALDSIVVSLDGQKVYLYNDAVVTYQSIELKADYIELDLQNKEVYAEGVPDSADVVQGNPIFRDGEEEFESKTMRYNFESEKGIITDVKTQQGEGYVHSERTKKIDAESFILKKGKYTTCDADHPHFYLRMTKAKVISNKKIITGPAYLVLEDFPIYFPMIPFGFFPNSPSYSSGIIIPSYGEEQRRGFFLKEGGYYWAASEFFDLTVKGDIYSKGSWATKMNTNYKKRYKFSGALDFSYNVNRFSEPGLPDFSRSPGFSVRWRHSQDPKANPFQTFSASVNLSTSSFEKENANTIQNYLSTTKSSSISYSKKWENSPFNMSASFRHSQNSQDTTISLTVPELTFSMSKIYPFKQKDRVGKPKWYEKIGISYTGNIRNSISTKEYELFDKSLIGDWKNGWKHSIPITLPNFNILKHINVSPSVSYNERWYTSYINREYAFDHVAQEATIFEDTIYRFRRNYDYAFSLSTQTNIYGMYNMKNPNSRIKAIRHKMSPSISFSYRPDFGADKYNFWDRYRDVNGKTIYYNRFEYGIFGGAGRGESGSINFSLANNLEAKVAAKNDTTGNEEKFEKIKIIDNLSLSTSYNLIADSLNLSPIRVNGRTTIKGVNLNFGGTINPYATDTTGALVDRYMWNEASGLSKLGRLTNANLSFGMSFKSKDKKKGAEGDEGTHPEDMIMPTAGQFEYYDFDVPWDFRFDYSFNYSRTNPYKKARINQSLNFRGRMNLTREWNLSLTTNFDIEAGEFSFTTFNINRKLHCWNMSFNFVPFGQRKSYSFTINASSAMLKDLKVDKKRSWFDNN